MAESKTDKMRKLFAEKALDTEQMENVAGGTAHQTADDSRFLNVLLRGHPAQCDRYGEYKVEDDYTACKDRQEEIRQAWRAVGISWSCYSGKSNEYWKDCRKITREQAYEHAMNVMGKQLKHSDWYWPD